MSKNNPLFPTKPKTEINADTNRVIKLGDAYNNPKNIGGNGRGSVYDINGICGSIVTMGGSGNKPTIIVSVNTEEGINTNEQD